MNTPESPVKISIYDLALILTRRKYLFIVNFIIVALIASAIALMLPKWFTAVTVILPPSGTGSSLPSFLPKDLAGVAATFGMETGGEEIYQTILASRTLKERIVQRFNLRSVYQMSPKAYEEDVLFAFQNHLSIVTREDQSIVISVEDTSPERAAEMANALVEELDRRYAEITSASARKNREFTEKRLNAAIDSLKIVQEELKIFQQETHLVSLPDQIMATIKSAGDIKAEQIASEVQLEVLQNSFGDNHPLVKQLRAAIRQLQEKHNNLIEGTESEMLFGLAQLPEVSQKYADILRRLRMQNSVLEFIYPQYEAARIQEQRETVNVQILDQARVPERKSRPPRKMIVLAAGGASLLLTLMLVLLIEYFQRLQKNNPNDWEKFRSVLKAIRGRK